MTRDLDETLPQMLTKQMEAPRPGRRAQAKFSHELSYGRHFGPAPRKCRHAAVLVLLRWDGSEWSVPLTKRPSGRDIHSGQICCPGGGIEANEDAEAAALRECNEEIGWAPTRDAILGRLSPLFVYASNNLVSCVLATTAARPRWQADEREVAELIEVPLKHLCDPTSIAQTSIIRNGISMRARCYRWKHHDIWGATAMILAELVAMLTE